MGGFANSGSGDIVYADNVDFTGNAHPSGMITSNGQLLIGSTSAPNIRAGNITSTGGTVTITNGAGTINLEASSAIPTTFTENSGTATPSANNLNLVGSGSVTTVGSGSTVTTQLTGLTNHSVLVGAGTATITKVAPSATSGVPLVSQGASSDPSFGTAVVAGGGTGNTTFTAYSVICAGTTATGVFQNVSGVGSSGQVLTSNGAAALPSWQAASGVTPWTVVAGTTQALAVNNGYTSNNAGLVTMTLPVSAAVGDTIIVSGLGAGGWTIAQNASQLIHFGASVTTTGVGGSISSTNAYDSITITCVVANNEWITRSSIGNLTVV